MQLRQEINILDSLLSAASGASATSNEIAQLDTTQYNGTVTYYFEIVADSTVSLQFTVTLVGATDGTLATITVPVLTTAYTLFRSTAFTVTTATQNLTVQIANTVGATKNVKSARVIIIQNATTLTNTETQIEIGNASSTTTTTNTALTNPKYWLYTAANWDGTITAYFEGTFQSGTSKSAATMTLQSSSSITAPSWSDVASSAITTTSTSAARVRSGAITLTNGLWYRAVMKAGNSKSGITVYNAKIIIDQRGSNYTSKDSFSSTAGGRTCQGGTAGSGETYQALGQSFTTSSAYNLGKIELNLQRNGSPSDNIYLEVTSSIGGTVLGTSANVAASGIPLATPTTITFTFTPSISLSASTKYYLQLKRTGARDTTNNIQWNGDTSNNYANGGSYVLDNTVWGAEGVDALDDFSFNIYDIDGATKLEPQYLLANTLFAAGTGLQTFLTDWDSTEWDAGSGTITYYFQAEAADGSTSDVTLEQADGGGTVTNSTLTNIDNAQVSSALTMPGDENLDTKATTNAGDVAAARILVAYVFSAAAAGPATVETSFTRKRAPASYTPGPAHYIDRVIKAFKPLIFNFSSHV